MKSSPVTVAVVEDQSDYRKYIEAVSNAEKGFRCVGSYITGEDALRSIPALKPDVVLMDINLPGMSGIECVKQLKALSPSLQIMMLTMFENDESVFNSLLAGATGYIVKRASQREILKAIKDLYLGGSPMSSDIARKVVRAFQQFKIKPISATEDEQLTKREEEILSYLSGGHHYQEIADALFISYDTVRTHIQHIYKKLHVHSRSEAMIKTLKH
ncbi:MAG: response regulator transcription factor [Bacteroidota bacterium]|nr:response regulator transcription factor [Bacteroidota bacterium]